MHTLNLCFSLFLGIRGRLSIIFSRVKIIKSLLMKLILFTLYIISSKLDITILTILLFVDFDSCDFGIVYFSHAFMIYVCEMHAYSMIRVLNLLTLKWSMFQKQTGKYQTHNHKTFIFISWTSKSFKLFTMKISFGGFLFFYLCMWGEGSKLCIPKTFPPPPHR